MGTNRRYPHNAGRLAEEREIREARQHGPLQSLSRDQLDLHREPMTRATEWAPIWGLAWVRFGDRDVRTTVRVEVWTVCWSRGRWMSRRIGVGGRGCRWGMWRRG
ncbi:MAG: hypothetical protein IPJ61_17485 [Tessaracoccus sp.]|uniref:hypothetical protein n=1 Tax=Tessaracoccus sp. TaxID=1971211 RepID=UPI001ECAB642|nr:hypothetical protein [Tessaracoccus sp.]MBK7822799.1 hypothetical protein [Tessaracoccus sp.]